METKYNTNPGSEAFVITRMELWDSCKKKHDEDIQARGDQPIKIQYNGKSVDGIAYQTTPMDIAIAVGEAASDGVVVAKVNGQLHDLHQPIEGNGTLDLFDFESPEGKMCFWNTSSLVLKRVMEIKYAAHLALGPALDDGFYCDSSIPSGVNVSSDDLIEITSIANQVISENQPIERLVVSREVALKMFEYNKFKQELLNEIPDSSFVLYRCGSLIDMSRGPHLPNTSFIKAFLAIKTSGAYWKGKADNPLLQRVYGVSFPEAQQLAEWKKHQDLMAKRDHRVIGKQQGLFFFHPYSPGSAFILPHGGRIYNRLVSFMKSEYHVRGFQEVLTPNMFNKTLWETSGHWQNYRQNMFELNVDNTEYALKPMNCPGHCLMFEHSSHSYRDLPLRFADFGVLHRNELAGALTGLTRVRRFQQDDAHIFCAADMIQDEIKNCLEFMEYVYGKFGFQFDLELSTRPDNYLGEIATWEKAEKMIADALNAFGKPWKLNPGDGAFYGPKIDIHITDAMNRSHQCATIQLDFQLPLQFKLKYTDNEGKDATPVMIHRAVYGSIERLFAILIEHTAGKWPFWLSPRQCIVVPVAEKHYAYALKVKEKLIRAGYYVDADLSSSMFKIKVYEAQSQYNFILVVGDREMEQETASVRSRDKEQLGAKSCEEIALLFAQLVRDFK